MKIKDILVFYIDFLEKKNVLDPKYSAQMLIADVLGYKRFDLGLYADKEISTKQLRQIDAFMQRRGKKEPIEYILGFVDFLGCRIHLNNHVLIPRVETEILAAMVAKEMQGGKILFDLCCGSGCIGISLKRTIPDLQVYLSDISFEAICAAKKNAEENGVDATFYQGDLLKPFKDKKAHYVMCNPPYVSEKEYADLSEEVQDFEPKGALVGGKTGLEFYERLSEELPQYLYPGAKIFFEIGCGQEKAVKEIFCQNYWKNIYVQKDWAQKDRFFSLEFE